MYGLVWFLIIDLMRKRTSLARNRAKQQGLFFYMTMNCLNNWMLGKKKEMIEL